MQLCGLYRYRNKILVLFGRGADRIYGVSAVGEGAVPVPVPSSCCHLWSTKGVVFVANR
jgi:hypothetical protein